MSLNVIEQRRDNRGVTYTDFTTSTWLTCTSKDTLLIIASNILPEPVEFDSGPYEGYEITFNSIFRQFKLFCFAETIKTLKLRIINARRNGINGLKLTKEQAKYAWTVVDIIKYQKHLSKKSYLDNGWGKIECIINDLSQSVDISPNDKSVLLTLFSRSCLGLIYPKDIAQIRDTYWDSIKTNLT